MPCAEHLAETPENTLKLVAAALCCMAARDTITAVEHTTRAMRAHCPPPVSYGKEMQRRLAGRGMIPKAGGSGAGAAQQACVVRGGAAMEGLLGEAGCGGTMSAAVLQRIIHIVQVWAGMETLNNTQHSQISSRAGVGTLRCSQQCWRSCAPASCCWMSTPVAPLPTSRLLG